MTDNLQLAQMIAWDLALMMLVPVTLFKNAAGYGVVPSAEFEGDAETIVTEYDPFDR